MGVEFVEGLDSFRRTGLGLTVFLIQPFYQTCTSCATGAKSCEPGGTNSKCSIGFDNSFSLSPDFPMDGNRHHGSKTPKFIIKKLILERASLSFLYFLEIHLFYHLFRTLSKHVLFFHHGSPLGPPFS